jgi:hypothetical protein
MGFEMSSPKPGRLVAAAALALAVVLAGACSSSSAFLEATNQAQATLSPTPSPTPLIPSFSPTPRPTTKPITPDPNWTPTPEPFAATPDVLAEICAGHGVAEAPAYSGTSHPIAVVDLSDPSSPEIIGVVGPPGDIQGAACAGAMVPVKTGSCGLYKRSSDGKIGYLYKYRQTRTVSIRIATTGKLLTSKVLSGNSASCNQSFDIQYSNPPWRVYGGAVTDEAIMTYAASIAH